MAADPRNILATLVENNNKSSAVCRRQENVNKSRHEPLVTSTNDNHDCDLAISKDEQKASKRYSAIDYFYDMADEDEQASGAFRTASLLVKMRSSDYDYRFMGTHDLLFALQEGSFSVNNDYQSKIVWTVLRLLNDSNGEVQNLAVRCLVPLVTKAKPHLVETIVDDLCAKLVGDEAQLRDIASVSLKAVIDQTAPLPPRKASVVCVTAVGRLAAAAAQQTDASVQVEALSILADLMSRYGDHLALFMPILVEAIMPQLKSQRSAVRKRSICALGHLAANCSPELYANVIDRLLKPLAASSASAVLSSGDAAPPPPLDYPITLTTFVKTVGAVCGGKQQYVARHVDRVVPVVLACARLNGGDDELKECCLQACESMVNSSGKQLAPHIPAITGLCLEYISFESNYSFKYHAIDEEEMQFDDEGSDDCSNEEGFGDDDADNADTSWIVRRSAAKCLEAAITAASHCSLGTFPTRFYFEVSSALIARFDERDESVREAVFSAYVALLGQTKKSTAPSASSDPDAMETESEEAAASHHNPLSAQLSAQVPLIVEIVSRQLKEGSVKTRHCCLGLLSELTSALPAALVKHVADVVPGIQVSLSEKRSSPTLKIDTLKLVRQLLESEPPPATVFRPHADALVSVVTRAAADPFDRVASEALLALESLVDVISRLRSAGEEVDSDLTQYAESIFSCSFDRLRRPPDGDLERQTMSKRAISCAASVVANLGDLLEAHKLRECLTVMQDRLGSEATSHAAVEAILRIASSRLEIGLEPIRADSLRTLATFLRQHQRIALRLATLRLLHTLILRDAVDPERLPPVLMELPALLTDRNLHSAQLTMTLLASATRKWRWPREALLPATVAMACLPKLVRLALSPLLHDPALAAMLDLYRALASTNNASFLSPRQLVEGLLEPVLSSSVGAALRKQALSSIAKCVSAVVLTQSVTEAFALTQEICARLHRDGAEGGLVPHHAVVVLVALGEIGRHIDLSLTAQLMDAILRSLDHSDAEVRTAASRALGGLGAAIPVAYLPFVLRGIETQPGIRYLLLQSLKEILSRASSRESGAALLLRPHAKCIWAQLLRRCESDNADGDEDEDDEATRHVAAQCLGKLCLGDPETFLPELQRALRSASSLVRIAVVAAFEAAIVGQPQAVNGLFKNHIADFLIRTLEDPDFNVRRAAVVAFNSAAYSKTSLIGQYLGAALPSIYNQTRKRPELMRVLCADHEEDDGLDLRKAAFGCLRTLLDKCSDGIIDFVEFLGRVQEGLRDHYDIKMLSYLLIARASQVRSDAVLTCLDQLGEPLFASVAPCLMPNRYALQEVDSELIRSAMKAVAAVIAHVPKADSHPLINVFVRSLESSPGLTGLFAAIRRDVASAAEANANTPS